MKKFYLIILFAFLASFGSYITAAEKTITYTFITKDWNATDQDNKAANWVSGEAATKVGDDRGIAVEKNETGANATSPISFNNIKKVKLIWGTSSKGVGDIVLTVGGTDQTAQTVSKGQQDQSYEVTFDTPVNGYVKFTVKCTTSTIYIKSVAVTYEEAPADQVATPKFTVADGYYSYKAITASATTTTEGATVHYSYTKNGEPQTLAPDTQAPVLSAVGIYDVTAFATDDTGTLKPSGPITATYTIVAPDAPTADPKPGTYSEATTIKFTSPEGTTVRVKRGDEYFTFKPGQNLFTKELTAVNGEKTTYTFEVWTEYNDNNSVRVFYTYIIDPNAKNDIFARINSVEHFAANDEVIIVSEKAGRIMSTYGNNGFNGKSDSVEGSYTIPFGDNEISILTIENVATDGTYKLKCADGKYLNLSNGEANITTTKTGSENEISFDGNNVSINNDNSRSIAWRAGSTKLFKHYSNSNINDSQYFHVQLYKKLTGDGNLTARLRYHENNEVIDDEENVADGTTYENIGAILLSSETAVNYALVGEKGTQIGTTEPGKTSVLTFPGVGKYILATSNKVISFTIGSVVSGVQTIAADAAKVYGANGNIVVEAEAAADVNVYNAAGMLVAAQKVGAGRTNIALAKGFYVVRAGNTVTKVAVR